MKTTTVTDSWNIGQFNLTLTTEADAPTLTMLQQLGLRWLGQRNSAVDKTLGAFTTNADGKSVRRSDFVRQNVDYTPELAASLVNDYANVDVPDFVSGSKDVTIACTASVEQKVDGGKAPKFAEEKAILARHTTDGQIDLTWLREVVKFTAPEVDVESDVLLRAVKSYKIAALKGL